MNKNEEKKQKRPYLKPKTEIHAIQPEKNLMIAVSGTTTPEESQAKEFDMWTVEENDVWEYAKKDLWDNEED